MMGEAYKRPEASWHAFFLDMARLTATMSKDPDRKVGAVLVTADRRQLSVGYNGFPAEMPDSPRWLKDKEIKLAHMVHAEENCLRQAPFDSAGCTMYVTRFPCCECAARVIAAGVAHVVAPRPDFGHLGWGESWIRALASLRHAHVSVTYIDLKEI